jgi:predicted ester cyclase
VKSVIQAFPDIQWTIEDLISEDNKVVVRWSWQGTHTGTFREFIPPSQNTVTHQAINIYKFSGAKITKAWMQSDRLGFLQQLDLIPEDLRSLSRSKKE